jgi:hypothetical protein
MGAEETSFRAQAGNVSTEAGWHQDPAERHRLRFWDGNSWTDLVRDERESHDPLPAHALLPPPPGIGSTEPAPRAREAPPVLARVGASAMLIGAAMLGTSVFLPWKPAHAGGITSSSGWGLIDARSTIFGSCGTFSCTASLFQDSSQLIMTGAVPLLFAAITVVLVILVGCLPWRASSLPVLHGRAAHWVGFFGAGALVLMSFWAWQSTSDIYVARYGMFIAVYGFVIAAIGVGMCLRASYDTDLRDFAL